MDQATKLPQGTLGLPIDGERRLGETSACHEGARRALGRGMSHQLLLSQALGNCRYWCREHAKGDVMMDAWLLLGFGGKEVPDAKKYPALHGILGCK